MNRSMIVGAIMFTVFWGIIGIWEARADYTVQVIDIKQKYTNETKRILHLSGSFEEGIADAVKELLEKHDVERVVLNSYGGQAYEGYKLGNVLSDQRAHTHVAKGTVCLSACAIAFIGGEEYTINGVLGFHKTYIPDEAYDNQPTAFNGGHHAGIYSAYYYLANGFTYEFVFKEQELTDPENFIVMQDEAELDAVIVRKKENDNINNYLTGTDYNYKVWDGMKLSRYLKSTVNAASDWDVIKVLDKREVTK